MLDAAGDARRVDIHADRDAVVHRDRERLRAAHAAEPAGEGDRAGEGAVELSSAAHGREGLERALQDALRADVDPRAGGHLPVHREAELLEAAELVPVRPVADEVRVREQHARRPLVRLHDADRLARLHEQRLVALERVQRAHDRVEARPVARGLAGAAVHDEILWVLGDLRVEVVLQHAQRGLLRPAQGVQFGAAVCGDHACLRSRSRLRRLKDQRAGVARDLNSGSSIHDELDRRRDVGGEVAVGPDARHALAQRGDHARADGSRGIPAHLDAARGGHELDREHALQPVDAAAQLAGGAPAHRHVVLLHRRRRDRVDGCRRRQPLELAHDPGLRVLRDHVPRVDARVRREERVEPAVAALVEEPVGAALAHARDIRDRDREEVEHVADRRAVEVAVRLDPAVEGDHRVVDRARELALGDRAGVVEGVARRAVHLRGAAQRVRVLHAGEARGRVARDRARSLEHGAHVRGAHRLAGMRPQRLQVGREHAVGAREPLDAHRGGEVGGREQRVEVVERERQHPEHAVGAVDEGEPLLLLQDDRLEAGGGEGGRAIHRRTVRVAHVALAHDRQRAVRERREVARAAEAAVLADDRRDAGVEHVGVGLRDQRTHARAPGRHRREAQQHRAAHDLALHLRTRGCRVAAHERPLQLLALLERNVLRRERAEAGRDAVVRSRIIRERLDDAAGCRHRRDRVGRELDARAVPRNGHDLVDGQRADADGHGAVDRAWRASSRSWVHRTTRMPRRGRLRYSVWDTRQSVVSEIPDETQEISWISGTRAVVAAARSPAFVQRTPGLGRSAIRE